MIQSPAPAVEAGAPADADTRDADPSTPVTADREPETQAFEPASAAPDAHADAATEAEPTAAAEPDAREGTQAGDDNAMPSSSEHSAHAGTYRTQAYPEPDEVLGTDDQPDRDLLALVVDETPAYPREDREIRSA